MEFPYRFKANDLYPIIEVTLEKDKTKIRLEALVDSGATISVFQGSIAEYLGIEVEKGERRIFQGIGGKIVGYIHEVIMQIDKIKFPRKIAFSDEITTSLNILGRVGFFEKFLITFNEINKKVKLELR